MDNNKYPQVYRHAIHRSDNNAIVGYAFACSDEQAVETFKALFSTVLFDSIFKGQGVYAMWVPFQPFARSFL